MQRMHKHCGFYLHHVSFWKTPIPTVATLLHPSFNNQWYAQEAINDV
jgi:hypothetical protein